MGKKVENVEELKSLNLDLSKPIIISGNSSNNNANSNSIIGINADNNEMGDDILSPLKKTTKPLGLRTKAVFRQVRK